jgi:hypothetical protein
MYSKIHFLYTHFEHFFLQLLGFSHWSQDLMFGRGKKSHQKGPKRVQLAWHLVEFCETEIEYLMDDVKPAGNEPTQVWQLAWQLASTSLKIKEHSHKFVTNLPKNFGHPKKSWEKLRRGLFWMYLTSWIRIWSQFASKKSRSWDINVVVFGCPQLYTYERL